MFDDVAMSAAGELMNQMGHASAAAMAQFLGDTMDFADCQLTLSDGRQSLASVMGCLLYTSWKAPGPGNHSVYTEGLPQCAGGSQDPAGGNSG